MDYITKKIYRHNSVENYNAKGELVSTTFFKKPKRISFSDCDCMGAGSFHCDAATMQPGDVIVASYDDGSFDVACAKCGG